MLVTIGSITRNMVCKPKQGLLMQTYGSVARDMGDIPEVWQANQTAADRAMHSQIYG